VDLVGRDVDEIALRDGAVLAVDGHDPPTRGDVVELVGRMGVRVDVPAAGHLELVHQFEVPPVGDLLHLPGFEQPPHRHGAVVLDDRLHVLDAAHVHRSAPSRSMRRRGAPLVHWFPASLSRGRAQ